MVWYSHLLKNFPQFIVIHTVRGFDIVNKAEILRYLIFVFFQSFWLYLEGNMGSSVYLFYFSQH